MHTTQREETEFDAGFVVVPRAGQGLHQPPDSVELKAECGHQVWVTPDALEGHDDEQLDCPVEYLCSSCWLRKRGIGDILVETRLGPGVFDILRQRDPHLARHAATVVHDLNTQASQPCGEG